MLLVSGIRRSSLAKDYRSVYCTAKPVCKGQWRDTEHVHVTSSFPLYTDANYMHD